MANWKLSPEYVDQLEKLNSSYRIKYRGNTPMASVVDLVTEEVYGDWHEGVSEEDAVSKAITHAKAAPKPMTHAQLVQDNNALRAQLAKLQGTPTATPTPAPPVTAHDDEDDEDEAPASLPIRQGPSKASKPAPVPSK